MWIQNSVSGVVKQSVGQTSCFSSTSPIREISFQDMHGEDKERKPGVVWKSNDLEIRLCYNCAGMFLRKSHLYDNFSHWMQIQL